jgi:hypothetical protein
MEKWYLPPFPKTDGTHPDLIFRIENLPQAPISTNIKPM